MKMLKYSKLVDLRREFFVTNSVFAIWAIIINAFNPSVRVAEASLDYGVTSRRAMAIQ